MNSSSQGLHRYHLRKSHDIFPPVGIHTQQTSNPLALILGGVVNRTTLRQLARINADVRQATDVWVGHDLNTSALKGASS